MNIKFRVLFAHYAWNALPGSMQILISRIYATIYKTPISRYFIQPFCRWHQLDHHYLNQFISPKTKTHRYISFQDFFTNIFLHNQNYYRIHFPIDGVIRRIEKLPTC